MSSPLGTIHGYKGAGVYKALIAAKYNNQTVKFQAIEMGKDNKAPAFLKKWPLGKVPVFEGPNEFYLNESNAIALYVANASETTTLLGSTKKESALIHSFINFADNEFVPVGQGWLYPIKGFLPFNAETTEKAKTNAKRALTYLNTHLATRTFLVGECVTMADVVVLCNLLPFYLTVFDAAFMKPFVHVHRWFTTVANQPKVKSVIGAVDQVKKAMVYDPKAAAAPAKKAKAAPAEDLEAVAAAEAKAAAKAKNPLDALPKSSFVLDEWKRFYSNNDTRPTAVDWFWKNYDKTGYSIWKVDYRYNSELTQVFMSSNLVGGFFQRLERARKYAFGSVLILGKDKDNEITGYFVLRGQEVPFEVSDSADYESYKFTKVNTDDAKVREEINAVFAWDDKVRGKVCADGKVFK